MLLLPGEKCFEVAGTCKVHLTKLTKSDSQDFQVPNPVGIGEWKFPSRMKS